MFTAECSSGGVGTTMSMVGGVRIALAMFGFSNELHIADVLVFLTGWIIIIINDTVFGARKTQLEIDRDETVKRLEKKVEELEKKTKESE